jgi:hypothetical protein
MTVEFELSRKTRRPIALLLAFGPRLALRPAHRRKRRRGTGDGGRSRHDNLNAVLWTQRSVEFKATHGRRIS